VELDRARRHGDLGLEDRLQGLPIDRELDIFDPRDRGDVANQGGHGLTAETDVPVGEHGLVLAGGVDAVPVLARDVGRREHPNETRMCRQERRRIGDRESRVGERRTDRPKVERVDRHSIRAEGRGARHLVDAIDPGDSCPDGLAGRSRRLTGIRLAGVEHGLDDLAVARASTQDPAHGVEDLAFGRLSVGGQQRIGGHQHAGRADPALGTAVAEERGLDRSERGTIGKPLDRCHVAAADLAERDQAGTHRLAIEPYGARPTVAGVAADLRARQAQIVTEDLAEPPHRIAVDLDLAAIDPERRRARRHLGHATSSVTARRTRVSAAPRR